MSFWGIMTLSENFRYSVPKAFMTTPIHVLCSYLTEIVTIVRGEMGETVCVVSVTKVSKMRFIQRHFAPVRRRALEVCRGGCHVTLRLPVKFRLNRFVFGGVTYSRKKISYDHISSPQTVTLI